MAIQLGKLVVSDSVVAAELDNESVLLNVETGVYFGLGEVGTRIWQLLIEGLSPDDIVGRLLDEYEVAPHQLRDDVTSFLEHLEREGLTRVENP